MTRSTPGPNSSCQPEAWKGVAVSRDGTELRPGRCVGAPGQGYFHTAAASHRTVCAAAIPNGASEVAAAHGLRRLAAALCVIRARVVPSPPPNRNHRPGGVTRPSKGMLSPRVEAGALGAGAAVGPLQAGKRWPGAVVHLQEQLQRRNDRSAQPRKNGPGRGAVDTSLEPGCVCSPADRPVLGSGQGGSSVGFGDPLVYRALAPAVPAQPPRQPVQKLKCAVPSKSKRFCLAGFLGNDPRHNGRSRNARGIGDPASAHQQHLTGSLDGPGQAPLIMGR